MTIIVSKYIHINSGMTYCRTDVYIVLSTTADRHSRWCFAKIRGNEMKEMIEENIVID